MHRVCDTMPSKNVDYSFQYCLNQGPASIPKAFSWKLRCQTTKPMLSGTGTGTLCIERTLYRIGRLTTARCTSSISGLALEVWVSVKIPLLVVISFETQLSREVKSQ